jgi:hypothetical protein
MLLSSCYTTYSPDKFTLKTPPDRAFFLEELDVEYGQRVKNDPENTTLLDWSYDEYLPYYSSNDLIIDIKRINDIENNDKKVYLHFWIFTKDPKKQLYIKSITGKIDNKVFTFSKNNMIMIPEMDIVYDYYGDPIIIDGLNRYMPKILTKEIKYAYVTYLRGPKALIIEKRIDTRKYIKGEGGTIKQLELTVEYCFDNEEMKKEILDYNVECHYPNRYTFFLFYY